MTKLLTILCMASFAFSQEPIKFRGAYIGEAVTDYVDCTTGREKPLKEGYRIHGKVCSGKEGILYATKSKGLMNPKLEGHIFKIEDKTIVQIKIFVPNEDWEKVRYDLTEKLGPPTSEVPQVYQNGFGARWEYNQGFWVKDDLVAYAGVKVASLGGSAIKNPFTGLPDTQGIEVSITDAKHARLPSTRPSTLD